MIAFSSILNCYFDLYKRFYAMVGFVLLHWRTKSKTSRKFASLEFLGTRLAGSGDYYATRDPSLTLRMTAWPNSPGRHSEIAKNLEAVVKMPWLNFLPYFPEFLLTALFFRVTFL